MTSTICSRYFWKQGPQMIEYIQACGFNAQVVLTSSVVLAALGVIGYLYFK